MNDTTMYLIGAAIANWLMFMNLINIHLFYGEPY